MSVSETEDHFYKVPTDSEMVQQLISSSLTELTFSDPLGYKNRLHINISRCPTASGESFKSFFFSHSEQCCCFASGLSSIRGNTSVIENVQDGHPF